MDTQDYDYLKGCLIYLCAEDRIQNGSAVRIEAETLINASAPSADVTRLLLKNGDPALLQLFLDRHGQDALTREPFKDRLPGGCPLRVIKPAEIPSQHLVPLIRIISPYIRASAKPVHEFFTEAITKHRDESLGAELAALLPHRDEAITPALINLLPRSCHWQRPFFFSFLREHAAKASPAWSALATTAVEREDVTLVVALMAAGVNFAQEAVLLGPKASGQWRHRFARRMSNAHDRLKMYSVLPPLEEVFEHEDAELRILTAGLSGKQRRKIEGEAKRKANAERWARHRAEQEALRRQGQPIC